MTTLRTTMLAASLLAAPAAAFAQPIQGIYIGAGAGGNYLQQERVLASPGLGLAPKRLATDLGGAGAASIGYGFGNGLRLELEGDIRHNRIRQISGFNGVGPATSGGDQFAYGGMVNALFDMDIGLNWLYPYIGMGAGIADTELYRVRATGVNNNFALSAGGWSTNFAYQGIFGLSFPLAAVPGLSLTTEYRFFGVLDAPSFHGVDNAGVGTPPHAGRGNFNLNSDYNHSLLLGVRYAFDTAPPAAAPAPQQPLAAVVPARTYLVFFDWDRSDLSDRARQIIAEAARNSTSVQTTRIEVQGNADASGTHVYNQRLSLRRAQTVAAELVRHGVSQSAIDIQAFGDTRPLVPTAPGVREPQNRRVAIILK